MHRWASHKGGLWVMNSVYNLDLFDQQVLSPFP